MPSACTKPEKKASPEVETPVKQCITLVEKKVRNLEKRKGKLDTIREKAEGGTTLNADQKEAVGQYDSVVNNIEFARELQKQFSSILNDVEKQSKKQAKKESHERQQMEIRRIKELLSLQNLLDSLGAEDVRADFVSGSKGAVQLTEEDLDKLDEIYKLISPTRDDENVYTEQLSAASEHIVNFLDAREKEVVGTTYKDLKALVEKINGCGYFDAKAQATEEAAEEPAEVAQVEEEIVEAPAAPEETPAPVEQEPQESPDFTLQQHTAEPQPTANLDFAGDAAAATTMLGQPQQILDEPAADAAPDADTFFSTQPFPQPRPFNEIVSSVQTNFTFLQDSEIEQAKSSGMDPAVMAAAAAAAQIAPVSVSQPVADLSFLSDSAAAAAAASQFQTQVPELSESQSAAAGLQQFSQQSAGVQQQQDPPTTTSSPAAASAFDSDPTSMYTISQGLPPQSTGSQGQYGESSQPTGAGGFGAADSTSDAGPPQPIPMPGQYSTEADQSTASAAAAAPHDRNAQRNQQFAMNPNADIFQSMYTGEGQPQQGGNGYRQQSSGAAAADSRQQTWASSSSDFQSQGYSGGQYGGRRGNQQGAGAPATGGYRGNQQGRNGGGPNNMNGYRGGSNPRSAPGNQRGGNSRGGGYNGGPGNRGMQQQQGGGMRGPAGGSSGGSAYKGYPARNDYQPEGGYQGYNTSGFMQPSQGGPRGGPRNSVPRSGRNSGNYGNRMPPQ